MTLSKRHLYIGVAVAVISVGCAATYVHGQHKPSPGELYARENGPKLCYVLSFYPDEDGVAGLIEAVATKDFQGTPLGYQEAGEAVWDSVHRICPTYIPALELFTAKYGGTK